MVDHAKVVEMAKARVRPKVIAETLGCSPTAIHDHIRRARRNGEKIPHFDKGKPPVSGLGTPPPSTPEAVEPLPSHIVVPVRLDALLTAEAERTGKTRTEVAQRILEDGLLGKAVHHG